MFWGESFALGRIPYLVIFFFIILENAISRVSNTMIMTLNAESGQQTLSRYENDPAIAEVLSRVEDCGECSILKADEANVPVNLVISEPDQYSNSWILLADNFKPCNSQVEVEIFEIQARSRDDILAVVRALIVPLYRNAVNQLENYGHLFFWSDKPSQPTRD